MSLCRPGLGAGDHGVWTAATSSDAVVGQEPILRRDPPVLQLRVDSLAGSAPAGVRGVDLPLRRGHSGRQRPVSGRGGVAAAAPPRSGQGPGRRCQRRWDLGVAETGSPRRPTAATCARAITPTSSGRSSEATARRSTPPSLGRAATPRPPTPCGSRKSGCRTPGGS